MKDFLKLFKILYKNQNVTKVVNSDGKKHVSQKIVLFLAMLPLLAMFCVLLAFLALSLKNVTSLSVFLNTMVSGVQAMLIFLMISGILRTLYSSEDNAFLASLPLRPASVFFAKFTLIYVSSLKFCAVILLPIILTVSITYAAAGNAIFYGFFPLVILIVLFAPLLPLFLVTLVSMPLMWLSSFFKGRATLKTVITILLYLLLMSAYMVVVFFLNTSDFNNGIELSSGALKALEVFSLVMYPNKVILDMCLGISAAKNFGISIAVWGGILAITVILSLLFYRRITVRQSETTKLESKTEVSYKQKSITRALMIRDFKSIMRNPYMAMNCFANILLAPIFTVVVYFIGGFKNVGAVTAAPTLIPLGMIMLYSVIFLGPANGLSNMAYTREGESYFISKYLPVSAKESVKSKYLMSLAPPFACIFLIMILALALFQFDIITALLYIIMGALFTVGSNALNIYFDIKRGRVHWKTQADLRAQMQFDIKGIVPAIIGMLPGFIMFITALILSILGTYLSYIAIMSIFWSVGFASAMAIDVAGLYLLIEKGVPLVSKIGENAVTPGASYKRKPRGFGGKDGGFGGKGGMLG